MISSSTGAPAAHPHDPDAGLMLTVSDGKMNLDNAWRPIETAPRDRLIDIWAEGRRATDCRFSNGRWVSWSHAVRGVPRWTILNNPTHWMPPPDAPA